MDAPYTPVTPISLGVRYGILLVLTAIIVDFLIRIAGFSFLIFGIVSVLGGLTVSLIWLVLAHKAFKQINNNQMNFGQGLIIALVMMLIWGISSNLFNYVYLHYIDLDFVDRLKAGMTEFMQRNNVPQDQIEKNTARLDEMKVDLGQSLISGISRGLGFGLVMGAIVTVFTKRNPPEFE